MARRFPRSGDLLRTQETRRRTARSVAQRSLSWDALEGRQLLSAAGATRGGIADLPAGTDANLADAKGNALWVASFKQFQGDLAPVRAHSRVSLSEAVAVTRLLDRTKPVSDRMIALRADPDPTSQQQALALNNNVGALFIAVGASLLEGDLDSEAWSTSRAHTDMVAAAQRLGFTPRQTDQLVHGVRQFAISLKINPEVFARLDTDLNLNLAALDEIIASGHFADERFDPLFYGDTHLRSFVHN